MSREHEVLAAHEIASFVSGFSITAEFDASKAGSAHMEADAPADIVSAGGAVAAPVTSMFQVDHCPLDRAREELT